MTWPATAPKPDKGPIARALRNSALKETPNAVGSYILEFWLSTNLLKTAVAQHQLVICTCRNSKKAQEGLGVQTSPN